MVLMSILLLWTDLWHLYKITQCSIIRILLVSCISIVLLKYIINSLSKSSAASYFRDSLDCPNELAPLVDQIEHFLLASLRPLENSHKQPEAVDKPNYSMFKNKGRQGAHLAVELQERVFLLYPKLSTDPNAPLPLMRGHVVLKLTKAKDFDSISVSIMVISRWKLPGQSQTKEIPLWMQEISVLEERKTIEAGEHRYPFTFTLENCSAPDVHLTRKNWHLRIAKVLQAKACLSGKPDLEATLDTDTFMIHTNAYMPNEFPEPFNAIERHTEPGIGKFAYDFNAPAETVGNSLHVTFRFEAGSSDVRFLTLSGSVEQKIVWHSADEETPAEPIVERTGIFNLIPSGGLVIGANKSIELEKLARFPDHDQITATSSTLTFTTLQASHDLILEVLAIVDRVPRQFSIRRQLNLAGCTLVTDTVVLPTYDAAVKEPIMQKGAISSDDRKSAKVLSSKCICATTQKILDENLKDAPGVDDAGDSGAVLKSEIARANMSAPQSLYDAPQADAQQAEAVILDNSVVHGSSKSEL